METPHSPTSTTTEIRARGGIPGIPMLLLAIALVLSAPLWAALLRMPIPTVLSLLLGLFLLKGLVVVNPNESKALLFFGRYVGTLRDTGFWWINPFYVRRNVSLRARNFDSEKLKVNDLSGNPIEIAAVVVWRVADTAKATFDVEDFTSYVQIQTESALRHLAATHPYDASEAGATSLRGNSDRVNHELRDELTKRLELAGLDVLEARLSHLAYAPEIAGAMLQRQQAEAIIAARTKIVDGAVGMVQMALDHLKERGVVDLDEERKAAMVSNLLVVLCSERGTQPVVNAGTLYP